MFQTPRGTRDFMPEDMIKLQYITGTLRTVFESWGYDPIDTPAFEDFKLLSAKSGDAIKEEIYYFHDKSGRELGLRFDLTVPFARILSSNPNIPKPFRRYAIGKVWRYDRPGKLRWREFTQADIDVAGAGPGADIEIISIICEVMSKLGLNDFKIRINNRIHVENFLSSIGIETKNIPDVFRSIDKTDKIGEDGVKKELQKKGVSPKTLKSILEFMKSKCDDKTVQNIVKTVKNDHLKPDNSLVRGLEYYNGIVYEVVFQGATIAAGGNYDFLTEKLGGKPMTVTGISFGVDRIMDFINSKEKTTTKIYIAALEPADQLASKLRSIGLNCTMDLADRPLRKQLEYVNARGIPYVIFYGPEESKSGKLKIRDMSSGKEHEFSLSALNKLKDFLEKNSM